MLKAFYTRTFFGWPKGSSFKGFWPLIAKINGWFHLEEWEYFLGILGFLPVAFLGIDIHFLSLFYLGRMRAEVEDKIML